MSLGAFTKAIHDEFLTPIVDAVRPQLLALGKRRLAVIMPDFPSIPQAVNNEPVDPVTVMRLQGMFPDLDEGIV